MKKNMFKFFAIKKLSETIFTEKQEMVMVTKLKLCDMFVLQKKNNSLVIFYTGNKRTNYPQKSQFINILNNNKTNIDIVNKYKIKHKIYGNINEFFLHDKIMKQIDLNPGDYINLEWLQNSLKGFKFKKITVQNHSKGKGFSGVMKRFNFSGGNKSHGSSKFHRRPGSIGKKLWKGKKMPGRHGNFLTTIKNLKIINTDLNNNIIFIKGSIPGNYNDVVSCFIQSDIVKQFELKVIFKQYEK